MYDPKVNDYVRWTTELGHVHEGWVYYKGESVNNEKRIKNGWIPVSNYVTIEIATNPDHSVIYLHSYIKGFTYVYVVMRKTGMN